MIEIGSPAVYLSPGLKQIRQVRVLLPEPQPHFLPKSYLIDFWPR